MKKSFILYLDQKELFDKLPDEQAGRLIKHIFGYVNCEEPETDDLIVDIAFSSIKASLKRDLEKWENQLEQRREAGKASAKKRAERKATSVNERSISSNETLRNSTDNVSVSVSVSDSVSDRSNKRFTAPTIQEVNSYMLEKGLNNNSEAHKFFDYYESNGWKVGRNKMKDWKAAVRNWLKNCNHQTQQIKPPRAFTQ